MAKRVSGRKPKVVLSQDTDGNACAVLGKCLRAAKEAGWSTERIAALRKDMTAGNYDHMLQVALREFEVL